MDIVKAPLDFIGINLYTRAVVAHDSNDHNMGVKQIRTRGGEVTDFGWEVYPQALSEMILRVTKDYPGIPIYVTENGCSYGDEPGADGKVNDQRRVSFLRRFISEVGHAMKAGADVRGYFLWTFTDNFEWAEGFQQRFGIVYCDFQTQQRIVKESGHWYAQARAHRRARFRPGDLNGARAAREPGDRNRLRVARSCPRSVPPVANAPVVRMTNNAKLSGRVVVGRLSTRC